MIARNQRHSNGGSEIDKLKQQMARRLKLRLAAAVAPLASLIAGSARAANTEYDVINTKTDLTAQATYNQNATENGTGVGATAATAAPGSTSDVTFDSGVTYNPASFTINGSSPTFGSLNDLSTTTLTIANTGSAAETLTLGGGSSAGDGVAGSANADLLFVGTGATLNTTAGTGVTALGLTLAQAGNFDIVGTANINTLINDGGFGITKTGTGALNFGTAAQVATFTGGLTINNGSVTATNSFAIIGTGGTLTLGLAGSANNVAISTFSFNNAITVEPGTVANPGAALRTIVDNSGTAAVLGGAVTLVGGATLSSVQTNGGLTFSGGITGTGNFADNGGGGSGGATLSGGAVNITGLLEDLSATNTGTFSVTAAVTGATGVLQNSTTSRMILSTANSYTGNTTISAGVLTAVDGTGLPTTSLLVLAGGVLQNNGSPASFARALGTSGNTFEFNSGGGFSANGGLFTVNIGGGTALQWGSTVGSQIVGTLQVGSSTANNEMLLQNDIDLNAATRTINTTLGTGAESNVLSGAISTSSGTAGLTVTGTGELTLTGTNTYNGPTTLTGGTLLATPGTGLPSTSLLVLNGGTVGPIGAGTFSLTLGTAAGNFEFNSGGGFTAVGGTDTVNINGLGTPATLQWGSTVGTQIVGTLQLGSANANAQTLFTNSIDLNAATRTINVTAGTGADSNVISGVISNSSGTAGLTKTGTGTLQLTASNTYNGATTLTGGTLAYSIASSASATTANGLGKSSTAAANLLLGNGTTLKYIGSGGTEDRLFTVNGTAAGNGASLDASGTGAINYSNTGSIAYGTNNQTRTLTLSGTNNSGTNYTGNTLAAVIGNDGTGAVSVTKQGMGNWILTGNNSFTGLLEATNQGTTGGGALILDSATAWGNVAGGASIQLGSATNNTHDEGNLVLATGSALTGSPNVVLNHGNTNAYTDSITFDSPSSGNSGYTQGFGTLTMSQKTTLSVTQTANISGQSVATFGAVNLQAQNNQAFTFAPTGAAMTVTSVTGGTGSAATSATLNLQGNSTGNAITGAITNGLATSGILITKSASSTWTLRGVNTNSGATAVNGGTLALGTTGTVGATLTNSAVTVTGATLAVTPGVVTSTSNNIVSSLSLAAAGNLTMADGVTNTFSVTGAGTLAPASGTSPILTFDIGGTSGSATDLLAIGGVGADGNAKDVINLNAVGGQTLSSSYTLITAASGLTPGNFSLGTTRLISNGQAYSVALSASSSATAEIISLTNQGAASAYFTGNQGNTALNANTGGTATNWSSAIGGTPDLGAQPTSVQDVYFTATAGNGTSGTQTITALGQAYTWNTLNYTSGAASIILNNNGSANAVTINSGVNDLSSNAQTVNVPVVIGAAQTITNSGGALLSFTDGVTASTRLITFAGSSPTTISGSTAFTTSTGATVNSGAGAVTISSAITLGGTSTFTNNSSNTLNLGAIAAAANTLNVAGSGTTTIASYTGTGTIGLSQTGAVNITGTLNGGTSSVLTTSGTGGTLTLSSTGATTNTLKELIISNSGTVDIGAGNLSLSDGGGSTLQSTTGGTVNATGGGTLTFSTAGGTNFGDNGTAAGTTLTINAKITGVNGFEVYGGSTTAGTVVLTNTGNTFAGDVLIDGGILSVAQIGNTGATPSVLGEGTNIYISAGGTNALKYTGTGETTNRVINLNGTTTGGIIDDEGTGTLDFTANLATPGGGVKTLTLTGSAAGIGQIAGKVIDSSTANKTSVLKTGTGTWILTGASTYTGGTTISGGTLAATGTGLGTAAVTVSGGTIAVNDGVTTTAQTLTTGSQTWKGSSGYTARVFNTSGTPSNDAMNLTATGGGTLAFHSTISTATPFTVTATGGAFPRRQRKTG